MVGVAYLPAGVVLAERSSETTGANAWLGPVSVSQAGRELSAALLSQSAARRLDAAELELAPAFFGVVVLGSLAFRSWAGVFVGLAVAMPVGAITAYSIRSGTSLFLARYLTFSQTAFLVGIPIALTMLPRVPAKVTGLLLAGLMGGCVAEYWEAVAERSAHPGVRAAMHHVRVCRTLEEAVVTQRIWTQVRVAYYTVGGIRPVQVAVIPSRRLHGAIYLEDREVASPDAVFRDDITGFWFVSSSGYGDNETPEFPLPGRWRRVEVIRFTQDYRWEHDIIVSHYQRE